MNPFGSREYLYKYFLRSSSCLARQTKRLLHGQASEKRQKLALVT